MKHLQALALALAAAVALAGCTAGGGASSAAPSSAAVATPTPEPTPPTYTGNPLTGVQDGDYTGLRPVAITLRTLEGSAPLGGIASADVLVAGVSEGYNATLTALFARADGVGQTGPVGPGRDLTLQMALPLNAVPVHIDKNVYAANLLNLLAYQDLDGYHVGKTAFAFDDARYAAGYREENCWYTNGQLIQAGLDHYGASLQGASQPLFNFGQRPAPAAQDAVDLSIGFSRDDVQRFLYDAATAAYRRCDVNGDPLTDGVTGATVDVTNVLVLYASSGIKDDSYTREYDMTGGTGIYLTGGSWERIQWSKEDATAPLLLQTADGQPLTVNPGKSFIAIWGGYYGQTLTLLGADGAAQALPEKPALLESGIPDEAAAAAEAEYESAHALLDAQADLDTAKQHLQEAQALWEEAQETPETTDDDNAAYLVALAQQEVDAAQQALDALQPAEGAAPTE